jgi:type II secretory pathway component PulK
MRSAHASPSGFALPAVLVVVGMLALVFLVAVSALDTLAREAGQAKRSVEFEQAALSLEAKAAYTAAVEPLAEDAIQVGGPRAQSQGDDIPQPTLLQSRTVTPLHLDGRRYRFGSGRFWLSLKDAAGQINLDQLAPQARARLAAVLGAPAAQQAALLDRLADDMDPDDLKRMQGAEALDYAAAGLAPPRNRPFIQPAGALGVLGWREAVTHRAWAGMRDEIAAEPVAGEINVNTSSPLALQVLLGLTPQQARATLAARAQAPLLSMADLMGFAGPIAYDVERSYTRPNGRFALKVADPRAGLVYRARIVLTPQGLERPLWIEERSLAPATAAERSPPPADAPVFPDPAH